MLDLGIFNLPTMTPSLLAALFQSLANFSVLFLLLMYLQGVRHLTPIHASLLLVPGYIAGVFALSSIPPFELYLQHQLGAKAPGAIVWVSPFWAASADGAPGWVLAGIAGAAGVVLLVRRGLA